ncbi:MAG: SIS domain-containing protein [Methyloligellaceae bacterium]
MEANQSDAFQSHIGRYLGSLQNITAEFDWAPVHELASELLECWKSGRQVFICGNGGSGANAIHMANDYIYGISKVCGSGLNCHALSENSAVLTCLANDTGYENIFSYQLAVMAKPDDVLIVLSGSGNSPNVLEAIKMAHSKEMKTYGILGFAGGEAKNMVQTPIHFAINDMQISEDLQMIVANMIFQWLYQQKDDVLRGQKTADLKIA